MNWNRPKSKDQIVRALAQGLESAPEVAHELAIPIKRAEELLEELRAHGVVTREEKPTFEWKVKNRMYYRYRVAEAVA